MEISNNNSENRLHPVPNRSGDEKPRLDYLETELTRICNLHCRCCCNFIQLAEDEPPFYDSQAYERDLKQLKRFFSGIDTIRLMGGEPFLLKNIADYAHVTRELFPDSDLRIVTNGLLIPSIPSDTLAQLKKCGCILDISDYPPTARRRQEIVATLKRAGLPFRFGLPIRFFFKTILAQPADDPKPAFENCLFSHCHMLSEGGILTPCSYAYCIRRFIRRFSTDYPESDFIDLYKTDLNGRQILDWMRRPHLFCACCTPGMAPLRWKEGVHSDRAVPEDWLASKSVWTDRCLPFAQRMLKPAANALRRFMQKKRG